MPVGEGSQKHGHASERGRRPPIRGQRAAFSRAFWYESIVQKARGDVTITYVRRRCMCGRGSHQD